MLFAVLDVHRVLDNYATHKHSTVRAWLAARPRYHVHFTRTYALRLNQARWFALITQQAIRRGPFATVRGLVRRIDAFATAYNAHSRPFVCTATADSIPAKLERQLRAISGTEY